MDLDTINRSQAYISKNSYECVNGDEKGAKLRVALKSSSGTLNHTDILKPGFH